ncbi:MAG: magnesium transporter [Candidatus Paceibacterota bacterium]
MNREQKPGFSLEKIAQRITYRPKERMVYFLSLSIAERSAVFNTLSPRVRQEILKQLSVDDSVELLDYLDPRRVHHILDSMKDVNRRKRIISRLKNEVHAKIEYFTQFHPQANSSLVHLNYLFLSEKTTIGETAEIIEDYIHTTGKVPEVLVNRNGTMVGEVPLSSLVRERNTAKLGDHSRSVKAISYVAPREEIIKLITAEPHKKIVLLDNDGSVLGVVYSDDVLDILGKSPAAALYSFAGVEESERPFDGAWSKVRHRYKWLILNLGTTFLAAGVIALYEDTIAQIVLLTIYMPIIAGMGGNTATQTLAIMVRGIAIGEISLKNSKNAIIREVLSGMINGVITGAMVATLAVFMGQGAMLGFVVGLTMVISLAVAGFAGAFIPLVLRKFGKDPATSATIFITTVTDVFGFFMLLWLATLLLV